MEPNGYNESPQLEKEEEKEEEKEKEKEKGSK